VRDGLKTSLKGYFTYAIVLVQQQLLGPLHAQSSDVIGKSNFDMFLKLPAKVEGTYIKMLGQILQSYWFCDVRLYVCSGLFD